jgi:protein involved in plasmid replication-relaxation
LLTDRDQEILKVIHFYRYMTAIDVAYRLFSPSSRTHVREILTSLAGGGDKKPDQYLFRFGMPKATVGNVERIYTLGNRGRDFLVNHTDLPINWYFRPSRMASLNYNVLVHSLAVTRFLVAAHFWSKKQDIFKLIQTRISYELANTPGREGNTIIPDGWLLFERQDGKRGAILVEIDRGTEYQQRFKEHVTSRLEFVQSGACEKLFGEQVYRICYVNVGNSPYKETRRKTMLAWTREVLRELEKENWTSIFRFTDVAIDVYSANLFEEPVWFQPDSSKGGKLFAS